MLKTIDSFLNRTTMYRLVLYFSVFLLVCAMILSFFGVLNYNPVAILFSALFITTVSLIANVIFSWAFEAPTNSESVYITALILSLIIDPISSPTDFSFFSLAIWAAVWAMGSKYLFSFDKKHIFNPVAIAVAITALTINQSASWWVGTLAMMPFVLVGGLMIVRKIVRKDLVLSFFIVSIFVIVYSHFVSFTGVFSNIWVIFGSTPILFFAFVMLTEPLTTPPTKWLRIAYGAIVGFLFLPNLHIGSIYITPELALIIGNIFSYIVSPKEKLVLTLRKKTEVASGVYDFSFSTDEVMKFKPGQYLEWTIASDKNDSRGNRRYFTIASSPTEKDISMGVKFYPKPSSFKQKLFEMKVGDRIVASQRAGDFTLPKNSKKKLVFIAGGIGVTPFRSMIKYLTDKKEKRDIVMLYSNRTINDIAYKEIFDEAKRLLGIKTIYTVTDSDPNISSPDLRFGFIDAKMILREIPDYRERYFYISGPPGMVSMFENILVNIGVPKRRIITDFFPGFA